MKVRLVHGRKIPALYEVDIPEDGEYLLWTRL